GFDPRVGAPERTRLVAAQHVTEDVEVGVPATGDAERLQTRGHAAVGEGEQPLVADGFQFDGDVRGRLVGARLAAPGERQQARRLAAQDLAAHRAGVADLAVLLRGWIVPARQFRIAEMQLHGTARARVHRSAGEPEAALVRIDEVAPDAFERT